MIRTFTKDNAKRGVLVAGVLSPLAFMGSALAAEGEKAGLPQFDTTTVSEQVFWLVVLFAVFYFLMSRLALPRLTAVLEARQGRIETDLEQAQKLKEEAEKALAEFEKLMADARAKAHDIQFETRQKISAHAAERSAAVEADLKKEAEAAEQRIQASVDQAMAEIKTVASEAAVAIAAKVTGSEVAADKATDAVEAVLKGA